MLAFAKSTCARFHLARPIVVCPVAFQPDEYAAVPCSTPLTYSLMV